MSERETKLIESLESLKGVVQNSAERLRNLRKHLTNIETQLDVTVDTITEVVKEPKKEEVPLEEESTPAPTVQPQKQETTDIAEEATKPAPKRYYDSVAEEYKTFPIPKEPEETE